MNFKKQIAELYYKPKRVLANLVNDPSVILIYHRVINLEHDPQMLSVAPDNFYRQVEYLKKNFNIINIEEFTSLVSGGQKLPPRSLIITFDDGYADNFSEAVPILESLNVSALFYISTSLLNARKETWWDQLDRIFLSGIKLPASLNIKIADREYRFDTNSDKHVTRTYSSLHPLIKFRSYEEREHIMDYLHEWACLKVECRDNYRFMDFEEIKKMAGSASAVLGAHTHTHTPLSILDYKGQLSEIKKSKDILEGLTGIKIEHFSYPFGTKKDYNLNSIKACEELNFKMVCANIHSQVHSWTNRFELPRMLVRNWEFGQFKKNMEIFFKY